MRTSNDLPVFSIDEFEDYNQCQHCGNSFYIRVFDKHLQENTFLEKPHSHDFFIILLVSKGSGTHNIDFKKYDVYPGAVFFLSPGQIHNWDLSSDINGYILFFKKEYLLIDFDQNKLLKLPFFYTNINAPYLHLDTEDTLLMSNVFQQIEKEYHERKHPFHDVIRLNLRILLIEFERRYCAHKISPSLIRYQENQLHKFETLIDKHYKDHLSISEYADHMSVSIKQLNTLCKKGLLKTPGDLIYDRIILEAKRLLVHSDHSVSTIAQLLNYTDNSYFIRIFRKATGVTPEQFRSRTTVGLAP
jgi:AraC family transcriptional regulator, transcriptional activator of pobA